MSNFCKYSDFCTDCPLLRGCYQSCGSHDGVLITNNIKKDKNGQKIIWTCVNGCWDWINLINLNSIKQQKEEKEPSRQVIDGKKCEYINGYWEEIL